MQADGGGKVAPQAYEPKFRFKPTVELDPCSPELSRRARAIMRDEILPVASIHGLNLSKRCPLLAERDLLRGPEAVKVSQHGRSWKCSVCGKTFASEHYLDSHLFRSGHGYHVGAGEGEGEGRRSGSQGEQAKAAELVPDTCLADYCSFLRCSHTRPWTSSSSSSAAAARRNVPREALPCLASPRAAAKSALTCRSLFHTCFDDNEKGLSEELIHRFCDSLECRPTALSSSLGSSPRQPGRAVGEFSDTLPLWATVAFALACLALIGCAARAWAFRKTARRGGARDLVRRGRSGERNRRFGQRARELEHEDNSGGGGGGGGATWFSAMTKGKRD